MTDLFENTIWPAYIQKFKSKKSISNYRRAVDFFFEFTGVSFEDATKKMAIQYDEYLTKLENAETGKIKHNTHISRLYMLRSVGDFISKCNFIENYQNPFEDMVIEKLNIDLTSNDIPLLHDMEILFEAARNNPRDFLIFMLAAKCGLTTGEILSLRINSIIYSEGEPIGLAIKKNNYTRSIMIPDDVKEALVEYLNCYDLTNELFLNTKRNTPLAERGLQRILKEYVNNIAPLINSRNITLSDMRHAAVKYMKMGGAEDAQIASYMGNKSVDMYSRYNNVSYNDLEKGISYSLLSIKNI